MSNKVDLSKSFQSDEFNKAFSLVSRWDFSLTKRKLLEPDYAGWTAERADTAELNYKRYLAVTKALNGYQLIPNGDIDRFWHEHILDTRRYAKDCEELFDGFLHHYPYFGMRGESDNAVWFDTAHQSNELWESLFEEHLYSIDNTDAQKCPQSCPGVTEAIQFKPQKCPQSCPGVTESIQLKPQKCPQSCPGIDIVIDHNYVYSPKFSARLAA